MKLASLRCLTGCLLALFLAAWPGPSFAEHDGKLQVLLLGDSTTIGSICRRTNPAGPHLEDVIRLLLATEKDLPPVNVINQGRDGEFIYGLLSSGRYDREVARLPGIDYIFIRYGLNDQAKRETWIENFPKDYHDLIGRLRHDFPQARLMPATIIPYLSPERDAQLNKLIRQVADDEKLPCLDLYTRFEREMAHDANSLRYRRVPIENIPEQHRAWLRPFVVSNSVVAMDNRLDAHFRDVPGWFSDHHPNLAGYHVIGDETSRYLARLVRQEGRVVTQDETKPPDADAALRERCLSALRAGLASDEFWPSMHAAEALSLAGHGKEVIAALAQKKPADDQQRCGLAREAVRAGDRTQIPILLEILVKPDSNGHVHAAESLFKVAEVGDGKNLRASLAQDADLRLKLMAAAALSRCGHPTTLDSVRRHLTHSDVEIRKVCVWILGQLGAIADVPAIEKAMASERDPLARAYCQNALALLNDAAGRAALGESLQSAVPAVRTYAAEFAGYCRATEFRDRLIKLLDDETLDVRVRAAQSLIALSQPAYKLGIPITSANEDISRDVYPATAANPRYSEGSIAVLKDNTLLYATTEFIGGGADFATARIIARSSSDEGRTWGQPRTLQENTGKQNVMSVTLRRLVPDKHDGPLGLFYLVKNSASDLKVYLRVSRDEAATFGEPILVTDAPGYHVMNNDRVAVLSTGRLICPIAWTDDVFKKGGGHFVSFCYLSDDAGRTWRKSASHVDQPERGAMEPEIVQLKDGKLMMIIRTQLGRIATSISANGGDHWIEPSELPVQAPESPATIRRIPSTGDLLLIWNNAFTPKAGHGGKRTPLTAAISTDEGKTWTHVQNLENDPDAGYAYTSVTFHRDRALFSYYVSDSKSGRISSRFRSLPVRLLYAAPQ